jgi:hypothetical protein
MNTNLVISPFEAEIEAIVREYEVIVENYNDTVRRLGVLGSVSVSVSDFISDVRLKQMQTRCFAAIERATGRSSVYYEQAKAIDTSNAWVHLADLVGVTDSLLLNIRAGYLTTLEELVHGETFYDFLEMAQHLLDNGYKDAAAVIAGSTLENHLKQLCKKSNISVVNVKGKPKSADIINSELASAQAYLKLDQKSVTAWQDLRNKAAHGERDSYDKEQVNLLINGVRDFIKRIPA